MKLPIIRDCGCFSLRTGCIIIAMSELIYAVLRLYDGGRVVHDLFALHGDNPDASEKYAESKGYGYISEFGQMYFWFHAAALVSNFICAALLVHGVRTKNHSFFMPWLAGHFVVTVVFWAVALIVTLSSFTSIGTRNGDTGFAAACFCLLAFIYLGYIFTVVYSYYKQLEQEARARRLSAPLEIQVCVPPFVEDLPPTYEEVVKVNFEQKGEPLLHNVV